MKYQELIDDHDRIDNLAHQLESIARDDRPNQGAVNSLLAMLNTTVELHLCKEDGLIYPRLAASVDPANAQELVEEFEDIKRDWEGYLRAWEDGQATKDWPAFQTSTIGMLGRLRIRVMKETGLLYGMALREGVISMWSAGR